jgi:hypothetical protein
MTDEQINVAIAEACGWECIVPDVWHHGPVGYSKGIPDVRTKIPDYCNDLNAMHEAEKVLTIQQKANDYEILLETVTRRGKSGMTFGLAAYLFCHATARQRAEAFLRTLGKWEEGE